MDKKILILLPIWGREKIVKICFDNLIDLQKRYDIEVLCICSEPWSSLMALEYGFKQVYCSNNNLGAKMNAGVKASLVYDYDYLMNLGSDDIINDELFECYKEMFEQNKPVFGSTRVTFIDSKEKIAKTCDYGILIGAGRCIRKDVVIDSFCKDGEVEMYDDIQRGLDMNSMSKMSHWSMTEIENPFTSIYDIKSDENIWAFDDLGGDEISFNDCVGGLTTNQIDNIIQL